MKINYVKLTNIGPYVNENTFLFDTSKDKNVILIGGKNGSGKTTFLESIKIGLFGSFSLGFKTDSKTYIDKINSILNVNSDNDVYSIEISVKINENYVSDNYIIKRTWYKKDEITEFLEIKQNENTLTNSQIVDFNDKLKILYSPELINCSIYDGELISNIDSKDQLSLFFENMFNCVFNINLYKEMSYDVNAYLVSANKKSKNDNNTTSFIELNNSYNNKERHSKDATITLNELVKLKTNLLVKFNSLENDFITRGGIKKEDQKAFKMKLSSLINENDESQKNIKHFFEYDFPLIICSKLLRKVDKQVKYEIPLIHYENMKNIDKYLKIQSDELLQKLEFSLKTNELIHNLNQDTHEEFLKKMNLLKNNSKGVKKKINNTKDNKSISSNLKEQINLNENFEYLDHLYEEMKRVNNEINEVNNKIDNYQSEIKQLNNDLSVIFEQINLLNKEISKQSTEENGVTLAKKFITMNNSIITSKILNNLNHIGSLAVENFNKTIRKSNYIKDIKISTDYHISLINYNNVIIEFEMLSAGEKQLLISSLVLACFKSAKRNEMFLYDTPIARLDTENRKNFIRHILIPSSEQVIILSTDSEIVGDCYDEIKNNIALEYTLKYDDYTKKTCVNKGYFEGK